MLDSLCTALFSVYSRPDLERKNVVAVATAQEAKPSRFDEEVKALEEKYGSMLNCTLTVDLQELNTVVPRHRVRIEAYRGLQTHLRKTKGVELIITSRKNKHHEQ